ncbi:hypothetical protein M3672_07310 [Microbacterium enclense]|uniref:hypothetical protein n=1 Tax=Microbacterium enclense TaxID=993073 RepID=UPI00203FD5BD|nr:hypothetical protein [Microbacterium enclense]MCM3614248.1 hypothetical protein [Microbacterium enclense]
MIDARIEVPEVPVRADHLDDASHRLRGRAWAVAPAAQQVVVGWSDLRSRYDAPETADLVERMAIVEKGSVQTSEAFTRVGEVLDELIDALRLLEKRRAAVVDDSESAMAGGESAGVELSIARLRADIAEVLDQTCRDLGGLAAPPPLPLAADGGAVMPVGPRVTWQMRTEQAASEVLLAPLVEAARGGAGRVRAILAAHPEWAERIRQRPPAARAVRDWWAALPPETRSALTHGAAGVVGALGGVPPLDRVAANRVVAQDRLPTVRREIERLDALLSEGATATLQAERRSALDRLNAERDYLRRVVAGDVQLVLYQPDENRIAEMIGTPGADTRRVLMYVPGTFTSVDKFHGGGAQALPKWLVDQDSEMVAFVWKGSEFPGDDEGSGVTEQLAGIREANDQARAAPAGEALASFVREMRTDNDLAKASQIAGGYSWGLVPVTGSEVAGIHYDAVHSFAGAWMPRDWVPDARTRYSHWSYTDFLSMAQDAGLVGEGRNPDTEPGFDSHIYDLPGDYDMPLGGDLAPFLDPNGPSLRISSNPFGSHELIVSDQPENFRPREDIRNSILEVGE